MTVTEEMLRQHLLAHLPTGLEVLHVAGDQVHEPGCPEAGGSSERLSVTDVLDLALAEKVHSCYHCFDGDSWADAACYAGMNLPERVFTDTRTDRNLVARRHEVTPLWCHDLDGEPAPACCHLEGTDPPVPWIAELDRMAAQHRHDYITQRGDALGPPTTWVALGLRTHLHARADAALEPLAWIHPWAVAAADLRHLGVLIAHLPTDLADAALARGATQLDPALLHPTTWKLAARLIRQALPSRAALLDHRSLASRTTRLEAEAVTATPRLLEVAHAATH